MKDKVICKAVIRKAGNSLQGNTISNGSDENIIEYLLKILEAVMLQAEEECRDNGCLVSDDLRFNLKSAMCYQRILTNYCITMHDDVVVAFSLYRDKNTYKLKLDTSNRELTMLEIFDLYLSYITNVLDIKTIENVDQFLDSILEESYE